MSDISYRTGAKGMICHADSRHATAIADDLSRLKDRCPEQSEIIEEAVSALYRQAAIIAEVKAVFRR